MAYKGNGTEFSIRVPKDLWTQIEEVFENSGQSHLSKNDKVLSLIKASLNKYQIDKSYVKKAIENGRIPESRSGALKGVSRIDRLENQKEKSPKPK